tara:strand:- start:76 stop:612 length:537 start_codon:yes stop_codon:yes gene_type:complete
MSLKTLVIEDKYLYDILSEISININFKIVSKFNKDDNEDYLIISASSNQVKKNQVLINNLPITIPKLIEIININFLRKNYNLKSDVDIGGYKLDLNSRTLSKNDKNLSLTEMEANVISFLKNSGKPTNIKELQKKVWGHVPDLETHTVETHIYRLRKKIKDRFQDDDFIRSKKSGYEI